LGFAIDFKDDYHLPGHSSLYLQQYQLDLDYNSLPQPKQDGFEEHPVNKRESIDQNQRE
jgi:hypothetical protein